MAVTIYGSKQNIIQVVSTSFSTTFAATTSGDTFMDITGFSVSITPSSASNKILIFVNTNINQGSLDGCPFRVTRNGTAFGGGTVVGSRQSSWMMSASNVTNGSQGTVAGMFLDSPATTSAITYQVQGLGSSSGGVFYVNRTATYSNDARGYNTATASTITVMEVAYS